MEKQFYFPYFTANYNLIIRSQRRENSTHFTRRVKQVKVFSKFCFLHSILSFNNVVI